MLIQWCCLLLLTPFLSLAKPLFCDGDTEYEWPRTDPTMCCKKCPPGEYLTSRCTQERETQCEPCGDDYYTDTYNFQLTCFLCTDCTKENMKYNQTCTPTRNAVCDCKSGYICNSEQCGMCVEDPAARTQTTTITTTTIKPPLPTKTGKIRPMTTDTKTKVTSAPYKENVWISLSLSCACVCILLTCFILISRHTPAGGWAMSSSPVCCFWNVSKSPVEFSQCTEEEEVPMPVQEVCGGKTEWQEEV
ncbi:tumor necrosis factor receptor superfamily member 5 isoform X3 [Colossoma macropomum]|uniref:tumor necrosis factor receptor superfamily member 5 isoform X3 n=1 Tax=Colossoma macropomum TaxID=42526 RepID=UPI00186478F7|nr:tumor necrosis factor receptor superfamily member 5 isoform X3 [Colossoma macropomum]